ncbi:MAG: alanine racemase [Opitutales bacterium]|nr:alanine racemase [Opitutales bacterium]
MESSHLPRVWAEIDLAAFERNVGKIKEAIPEGIHYISVVKADAYGHGVAYIVERLLQCGIDSFAVANAREGADVRYVAPQAEIYILGPSLPEEFGTIIAENLVPAISNADEADRFDALAADAGTQLSVNLKIDTGMGRMGVWHAEALPLALHIAAKKNLRFCGVFTHFSSADTSLEFTELQRLRFLSVINRFPEDLRRGLRIHADNSAGLDSMVRDGVFNAIRAGIIQYGLKPAAGTIFEKIAPDPVLSFHSRIGLIKMMPAGVPVSYNRTYTLNRETRIGIVTAGYGDGIPTAASNKAHFLVRGKRVPVLGRVTMDQTLVDLTDAPEVQVGDKVTIIGSDGDECVSIETFCEWGDCIPWEALVSITKRVLRIYRGQRN